MQAIADDDIELVRYHLNHGVHPDYQHPEFLTAPLIEAMRLGRHAHARLLLEKGANPQIKEAFASDTPLSVAIAAEDRVGIALLRAFGVDENDLTPPQKKQLKRLDQPAREQAWWKFWR